MVHDIAAELFIPTAYCLLAGKNEHIFCIDLHEIIILMEYAWMPRMITVDFEYSLISAVKHEFTEKVIDGINDIKPLLIQDESVETF
ncbi:hypothetical protein HZS_5213 [Henneguya salminicola]|nr:hypothetical protein HZS_5213 [Henneguya salminicola]